MSMKLVSLIIAGVLAVTAGAWLWLSPHAAEPTAPTVDGISDADDAAHRRAARDDDAIAAQASTLRGQVIDAHTRKPIANAVVVLARASGSAGIVRPGSTPVVPRTQTDLGGAFEFDGLPPGSVHVTAAAPGYLPAELEDLEIAAEPREPPVLALQPGGNALTGVVTDIGGGAVAGTWVVARARGDAVIGAQRAGFAAVTDDEGAYTLSLPDGSWNVAAGGDDYALETTRLTLRSGPGRADFQLVPAAAIHGRVVDRRTGEPIAGAVVGFERFRRQGGGFSVNSAKVDEVAHADANGAFVLRPLEPATYSLYASAPQRSTIVEAIVPIDIAEQITGVEVTVDPALDARGFAVDATDRSRGLGGIAVSVYGSKPGRHWFTTTAADGGFVVPGLAPGSYSVFFDGAGVIPSRLDRGLNVTAEGPNDGIFPLERGTSVRGRVSPARPGTIVVENRERTGGFEVMIAAEKVKSARSRIATDGSFTIPGVPPGEWRIVATADDGSTAKTDVEIGAEPVEGLELALQPRASVRGRVRGPDGSAIAGLMVRLERDQPEPFGPETVASATSDGGGGFEMIGVDAGTFRVAVVDAAAQPVAFVRPVADVVAAEGDGVIELELAVRPPAGRIEGRVHGADGEPVADAFVVAEPSDRARPDRQERPVLTDGDGRFVIEGLADRTYSVHARGPGERGRVSVEDVAIGRSLDLVLAPLGGVRGTVTMDGVVVERFTISDRYIRRPRNFIAEDGVFELDRIEPGELRLAFASEAGAASVDVVIEPGATRDVVVELAAWGGAKGVLVGADGTPLSGISIRVDARAGRRPDAKGAAPNDDDIQTDAEGRFEIEGVGPGRVTLDFTKGDAMRSGEMLGEHRFTLTVGETIDLGRVVALTPVDVPKSERGWLGFDTTMAPSIALIGAPRRDDAEQLLFVDEVHAGTPAATAGLRHGDRIVAIDDVDEAAFGSQTLLDAVRPARLRVGTSHTLRVLRDDEPREVVLAVVPQPQ